MVAVLLLADAALAAVAGDVSAPVREPVDGEAAAVGTAAAAGHGRRIGEGLDLRKREHRGGLSGHMAVSGNESGAEGAHDAGDVRPDDFAVRDLLKAPKDRVVVEGAALDDDIASQFGGVGDLDDLIERIFDHGIGESGGNVRDGRAFLLGLLDLGIHEDCAARAQVDRVFREERGFCEVLDRVIQRLREVLNKGAAAGGAGLVEHHVVDGVIADADALHVLTADIEDAVHVGLEEAGGGVVRDGLDLAFVQLEGALNEGLPVTGGTGPCDAHALRHMRVSLFDRADGRGQRIPVIAVVEGVEQLPVLGDQRGLRGRAAGVDAEIGISLVGAEQRPLNFVGVLPVPEAVVFLLGGKERLHAGDLEVHLHAVLEPVHQSLQGDLFLAFAEFPLGGAGLVFRGLDRVHGRAGRREEVRVVGNDRMLLIEVQGPDVGFPQLVEEVQRASEERDVSADRFAAGQSRDGLVADRLENGRREVFPGRAVVDQRLDVRFRKDAAAGGDGINGLVFPRVFVESRGVGLQKVRHLIDEGAGPSGADAVHPLLDGTVLKIDDLGVFAAQLDCDVGLRAERADRLRDRYDFLHEGHAEMDGQREPAGAGDGGRYLQISQRFEGFADQSAGGLLDLGVVPLVIGEEQLVLLVEDGYFYGCGTDVDSESVFVLFHILSHFF